MARLSIWTAFRGTVPEVPIQYYCNYLYDVHFESARGDSLLNNRQCKIGLLCALYLDIRR